MTLASLATALLLAGAETAPPPPPGSPPPQAAAAPAPPVQDPAALALLRKMSDRLRQARTFSFRCRSSMELPVASGGLATAFNTCAAAVRRPDGLAASRKGDLPELKVAYDGKTISGHAPGSGRWATLAMPPTLDAMILAVGEQAGLSFPFDELLVADPFAAITRDLVQAVRVDAATVEGKKLEHLVLRGPGSELEYWIDPATALPVRAVAVYADLPLRPHFTIEFLDWKIDAKLPDSTFALPRPAGARQVEFRDLTSTPR
jgi:hypothetical protein